MEVLRKDLAIVGAGPAGLSAAVYAVRSGLDVFVFDKGGGLADEAPWVENYLGFEGIEGRKLIEKFRTHASKYTELNNPEEVIKVRKNQLFTITTNKREYNTSSLIFAMGGAQLKLGVKGESEFLGKGVSYCATCDGFFFRKKNVVVVGGGNSAVIDAVYLNDIGAEVKLIHRRSELRAEKALQEKLFERKIEVIWDSTVEEIQGDNLVSGVAVKNKNSNKTQIVQTQGVFISIGECPNNSSLAESLGVNLDDSGYIITDKTQRTNIPMVYAAGDITGGLKQIATAVAQGAVSANSVYEDIKHPYWSNRD